MEYSKFQEALDVIQDIKKLSNLDMYTLCNSAKHKYYERYLGEHGTDSSGNPVGDNGVTIRQLAGSG